MADYMQMLRAEMRGERYSKTEHRRGLAPQLDDRSDGSIEFKHANISAALVHLGCPYIDGYKPRGNYQRLLLDGIEGYLTKHPGLLEELWQSPLFDSPVQEPRVANWDGLFVDPPEPRPLPADAKPWTMRRLRKVDFVRRDAENRRLGELGERLVVLAERQRLQQAGRDDLAERVEWVAHDWGDGAGFDVLSFDARDESERMIEVKTTRLGQCFPFYLTSNEVRCSEANADHYRLYRVFQFDKRPRIFVVEGALTAKLQLEPTTFRAVV